MGLLCFAKVLIGVSMRSRVKVQQTAEIETANVLSCYFQI